MRGYENTMPNKVLLELMTSNLRSLGVEVNNERRRSGRGSTDFGNVSRRGPGDREGLPPTPRRGKPRHPDGCLGAPGPRPGPPAGRGETQRRAPTADDPPD